MHNLDVQVSIVYAVAYAGKNFGGGVQGYGWPRRGYWGGAPRTRENFRKFAKNHKQISKNELLSRIFQKS